MSGYVGECVKCDEPFVFSTPEEGQRLANAHVCKTLCRVCGKPLKLDGPNYVHDTALAGACWECVENEVEE